MPNLRIGQLGPHASNGASRNAFLADDTLSVSMAAAAHQMVGGQVSLSACSRGCLNGVALIAKQVGGCVLWQVAKYTWREVNRGHYVIGSPDTGSIWLIGSSLSATSPR